MVTVAAKGGESKKTLAHGEDLHKKIITQNRTLYQSPSAKLGNKLKW